MAYHQLRIAKIVQETPDARSFVLEVPEELADRFKYRAGQFLIVLGVWAFQLLASSAWLRCFGLGPVEWVLRWVIYRRRPSFVRSSLAVAEV